MIEVRKCLLLCAAMVSLASVLVCSSFSMERDERPLSEFFPKHDYTKYDAENGKGDPFLFEIRVPKKSVLPGITHPHRTRFFLLGSQHNVPIEILQRSTHYLVERADVFITEIYSKNKQPCHLGDFSDISKEEMAQKGLFDDDVIGWRQNLTLESQQILDEEITWRTQKLWGVDGDKVSYAVINDYLSDREASWRHSDSHGMDNALDAYFEKQGKLILALEDGKVRADAGNTLLCLKQTTKIFTLDECLGLSHEDYMRYMNDFFRYNVELEKKFNSLNEMLKRYKNPPFRPLNLSPEAYPYFFSGVIGTRDSHQSVINRNKAWVPVLKQRLIDNQDKTILICVGFGHFEGSGSLLELLKNDGFELCPIRKKGHTNPRLSSFCNYTMNYTYEDLLKEAAKEQILNRDISKIVKPNDKILAQNKYRQDYEEFLSILEFYQDPRSLDAEWGPNDIAHSVIHDKIYKYCSLIKQYPMSQDKHQGFQRSNDGDYYSEKMFGVDLFFATSLILKKISIAKKNFCAGISRESNRYFQEDQEDNVFKVF